MIPPQLIAEVLTHAIAFLLLLWVLKVFAWRPVLRVLDERNKVIQERIDGAEKKNQEAEVLRKEYQDMLSQIEEEARTRMNEAIEHGRQISKEITEKARVEAREIREKAERSIQVEIDQARIDLKNRLVDITVKSAERLIRESLDDAKHRELVSRFIDELEAKRV